MTSSFFYFKKHLNTYIIRVIIHSKGEKMKRRDLIKKLEEAGWSITDGAKHDMAKNPSYPGVKIPVPRHKEIDDYTAKGILKEAGLI